MTIVHTYIPRPPLSDFVELLWWYDDQELPHARERLLPSGTAELVIDLRNETMGVYETNRSDLLQTFRGSLVCGPHSEYFVIDTAAPSSVIGVHFKPGGASPFLGLPAAELHNLHVSLDTLWGRTAVDLREQLLEVPTAEQKFCVLERVLLAQVSYSLERHPAVKFALSEFHGVGHTRKVADVTEQIGLSARRFIQVFHEAVGLTPKLYCRVQRFQEVLRTLRTHDNVDWTNVALACGYFDQAHFIHDFRAFSGFSPSTYLIRRGEHLNHVPLHE